MKEPEMDEVGALMTRVLGNLEDDGVLEQVRKDAEALAARFPLYE
jgi:glycine/serine hydroxymethyltransferase